MKPVNSSHVVDRRVNTSSVFAKGLKRLYRRQRDLLDLPSLDDRRFLLERIKVVFGGFHTSTLEHIAVEDPDKLDAGTVC